MKLVLSQLYNKPYYAKTIQFAKLVSVAGSAQLIVQAIGFISGILVIRLLPTQEYALYTLANTMLGTMAVLADGGIATGVLAQGGKVWQDRQKLGGVLVTGFKLRKKFAVVSLLLSIPLLIYLLHHHGATWPMSVLIVLGLIPAFLSSLSGSLLEIAPKLHQQITPLQKIQVGASASRLLLLSLSIFTFPFTFVAIFASTLPQLWANYKIKKIANVFADNTQPIDLSVQKDILHMVKRLLPEAVYYCFSGQITIWLISIYGSTAGVAQAGALGRLPVALTIFTVLFGSLVLPRFSRTAALPKLLLRQYVVIEAGLFVLAFFIIAGSAFFASDILMVLGPKYENLQDELIIMMVGSAISYVASSTFFLSTCRGWVINPAISISISIAAIILGVSIIDISSLKGIFLLNVFTGSVHLMMHISYGFYRIVQFRNKID